MSAQAPPYEIPVFISPADLRTALRTNSQSPVLSEVANAANSQITFEMQAYAESTPVKRGTRTFQQIQRVGLMYAMNLWHRRNYQNEIADGHLKDYERGVKTLKDALKHEPTTPQDPIAIERTDFGGERLVPYMQIGFGGSTENLYS